MRRTLPPSAVNDPAALARFARLDYVTDQGPGFSRRRNGHGFVYLNNRGEALRDPRKIKRIESLVIPPAWKEVWICPTSKGHLQATGRDDRQRKQYLYHERWQYVANLAKFARMGKFGQILPKLRRSIARTLAGDRLSPQRVLAGMVALLDLTGVRIGNEEYARENGSYGLSTLRDRHIAVRQGGVELRFRAKGGIHREVLVEDAMLAEFIQECAAVKGARLFQCLDGSGKPRPIGASDINEYLQQVAGEAVTAKDFRTWKASSQAAGRFYAAGAKASKTARKRLARETICEAANLLSNTPAVCRNYYIHPGLIASYEDGSFDDYLAGFQPRRQKLFAADEKVLARFLSQWKPAETPGREA
ncbi:MAG: DNA topoisomerase [Planctomycetota bacterium]|nr:MAG: DNA topoisomerase [Planctomycetota bacterium]